LASFTVSSIVVPPSTQSERESRRNSSFEAGHTCAHNLHHEP
jgi:hypothetical protein